MTDFTEHQPRHSPWTMGFPFLPAPGTPGAGRRAENRSWLTALRCRMHRSAIDRELAAGADPESSERRHLRASQLTAQSSREALAAAYQRLQVAATSASPLDAAPSNWRGIRAARPALDRLVKRLREDHSVRAAGVARARLLLNDRHSALHARDRAADVVDEVRTVLARL